MSADERTLGERVADYVEWVAIGSVLSMDVRVAAALLREQQARIAELERDLEAARVDAERYRTWRDGCVHETSKIARLLANCVWPSDYDAAIDLARARGEGNADE